MPGYFPEGDEPRSQDNEMRSLQKINNLLYTGGGGGGSTLAAGGFNYSGAGSPEGVQSGSPNETYWDTTDQRIWVKQTGTATNTGWV